MPWRAADRPTDIRCAALAYALRGLRAVCGRTPTPGRLSTWARVAWESGARNESVNVLRQMLQTQRNSQPRLNERFWPAAARFDQIVPGKQPANWFAGAVAEQYEKSASFSSTFAGASPVLSWLCNQTFASAEMERRRVLIAAREAAIRSGKVIRSSTGSPQRGTLAAGQSPRDHCCHLDLGHFQQ
jgi:hypothetical protein